MESVEAFKAFVKTMPELASEVRSGHYSWQQLYEMYALYGANHEIWNQFKAPKSSHIENNSSFDIATLIQLFKTIDVNALLSSLEGLEKVLGIAATLFDKEGANENKMQSLSRMDD